MKGMHQNAMLDVYSDSSLDAFSFESATEATLEMLSPRWRAVPPIGIFTSSSYSEHACNLQSIIRSKMAITNGAIVALKLQDFKSTKTPLCTPGPSTSDLFLA